MPVILVANPKGGVGKSTIATNLAGYFARQGYPVMLGDIDKQQSARNWLQIRPAVLPPITTWDVSEGIARTPKGVSHIVLDTPAGLSGDRLKEALKIADKVVVPLQPSMFDILATQEFLVQIAERKAVREGHALVGVVGMRVNPRTRAADLLQRFVDGTGLPILGFLRDTQNYVQLSANGLTLWDVKPARVERDLGQWQTLVQWVNRRNPDAPQQYPL